MGVSFICDKTEICLKQKIIIGPILILFVITRLYLKIIFKFSSHLVHYKTFLNLGNK